MTRPPDEPTAAAPETWAGIARLVAGPDQLLDGDDLARVVDLLRAGQPVTLPTDTGPLLGVDGLSPAAVRRLFQLKGRPLDRPVHVAVSDLGMARDLVELGPAAERLCRRLLPGPLTVVCPARPVVPVELTGGGTTLGIRIAASPVVGQVARALGRPITATSLNLSGRHGHPDPLRALAELHWSGSALAAAVLDPAVVPLPTPSTVVEVARDGTWQIIRPGPIGAEQIARALAA